MLKWLVLVSVVLYATAQVQTEPDKGCCTPDQWEGYIGQLTGVSPRFRRAKVFADGVKLSYDFTNKKVAEKISLRVRNKTISVGLVFDFNQKKIYRFLEAKKLCKVRDTKIQFRQFCIPDTAKTIGSFYYGAGRSKLQVTSYFVHVPKRRVESFIQMTTSSCIPVSETVIGARGPAKFITEMNFANITPGIKDPSVFNPPAYCQKSHELYEESYEDEVDEFMVQYIHDKMMLF